MTYCGNGAKLTVPSPPTEGTVAPTGLRTDSTRRWVSRESKAATRIARKSDGRVVTCPHSRVNQSVRQFSGVSSLKLVFHGTSAIRFVRPSSGIPLYDE